jgi:hypothetical protein
MDHPRLQGEILEAGDDVTPGQVLALGCGFVQAAPVELGAAPLFALFGGSSLGFRIG